MRALLIGGGGIAAVLVVVLAFRGLGGPDREELLRSLPERVEERIRDGDLQGAADTFLAPEFEITGLSRSQMISLFRKYQDGGLDALVSYVGVDSAEEGMNERSLVVVGLLAEGNPEKVPLRSLKPFRIEAVCRFADHSWRIISARLAR